MQAILLAVILPCIACAASAQPADDPQTMWSYASLYRDEWGVPHIYAETPRAMAFAFGYAQAEDHLEAMLMAYRIANGRAAEVLGESHAQSDAFAIKMGHARIARETLAQADAVTRDLCEGFALGVNAWLVDYPAQAPEWAEGVQPADVLALWRAFLMSMAPLDLPGVYRPPRAFDTGNAWALSPKRSVDGVSMLVINAHQYYDGPFQWYEAHLKCQEYNMAGAGLYGLPIIVQGHNDVLGWGLTPNDPDFADVFQEKIGGGRANPKSLGAEGTPSEQAMILSYLSYSQPYYVRTDSGMDERHVPALINSRGPVFEDGGGLYSWKVGGFGDTGGLYQLWEMGRSRDLSSFQNALVMQQLPCFHIVYADREGNLFYQYNAKCGVRMPAEGMSEQQVARGGALDWKSPVSPEFEFFGWREVLPADALPWFKNPERGYIQACGNPPWLAVDDAPLRAENWPAWLMTDTDSYRARRVRQLLRTGQRSFSDMHSMIFDVVANAAVDLVPRLLAAADERKDWLPTAHPDLPAAIDVLRGWNYLADTNTPGMTLFHVWWNMVQSRSQRDLNSDPARYAFLLSGAPAAGDLALEAAADAARMMRNEFQSVSVPWGEAHRIERGGRDEAAAGAVSGEPLCISSEDNFHDGRWYARYGYGFAMAVEFTQTPEAYSVTPFGASEVKTSPHYSDQMALFRDKRLKRARFDQKEVWRYAQAARGRNLTLSPLGVEGAFRFGALSCIQARLTASTDSPGPLPEGLAAFTLFMKPEWAPEAVPVQTDIELYVPEVLCAEEDLPRLSIHAYVKDDGWYSLQEQEVDPVQRVFSGGYEGLAVYAILGPADCLQTPPPDTAPATAPPPSPAAPAGTDAPAGGGIFAPGMPGAAPPPAGDAPPSEPLRFGPEPAAGPESNAAPADKAPPLMPAERAAPPAAKVDSKPPEAVSKTEPPPDEKKAKTPKQKAKRGEEAPPAPKAKRNFGARSKP